MRALLSLMVMVTFCSSSGASAEVGVTDTEIKLGSHAIMTGAFASFSAITFAAKAYFEKINGEGGIYGRKINLIMEDNAFSPAQTIQAVKKLIQREKVFALFLSMGVTHIAAYKIAQEAKVPDMFISDSSSDYTNPFNPYSFGFVPTVGMEGKGIGELLAKRFSGKKVGFLVPNTGGGFDMMEAVKAAAKDKVTLGPEEVVPWQDTDANAQVMNLMNAKVDVVVAFSAPPTTPNAIKFASQKGFKPQWILNDFNADAETLKVSGPASEGAIVVNALKDDWTQPPFVEHVKMMKKAYPNIVPSTFTAFGQISAEVMVEVLKRAGKDLTREGLIKAAETLKDYPLSMSRAHISLSKDRHIALTEVLFDVAKNGKWVYYQ